MNVVNFILEIPNFAPAIKLKFRRNGSGKRTVYNLQTKYIVRKSHVIKLIRSLTSSKYILNVRFKFISCQEISK